MIAGILLLGALALSTGVASAEDNNLSEQITPEELLTITIEDDGEYHGEGVIEICPGVASAFRSTLQAFSEDL